VLTFFPSGKNGKKKFPLPPSLPPQKSFKKIKEKREAFGRGRADERERQREKEQRFQSTHTYTVFTHLCKIYIHNKKNLKQSERRPDALG
jgi:hypothetical protein